jgi:hypothetical protein
MTRTYVPEKIPRITARELELLSNLRLSTRVLRRNHKRVLAQVAHGTDVQTGKGNNQA